MMNMDRELTKLVIRAEHINSDGEINEKSLSEALGAVDYEADNGEETLGDIIERYLRGFLTDDIVTILGILRKNWDCNIDNFEESLTEEEMNAWTRFTSVLDAVTDNPAEDNNVDE